MREPHDIMGGLARSYLFEGMTTEELAPLAAAASTRRLVRGETLFRIGDRADEIIVVLEGEVKDSVVDADGHEIVHFIHGPGMTVGEPGFFAVDKYRMVEVVALMPTVVIILPRRDIIPFMALHPSIKDRVLERLASNTRWQTAMISSLASKPLIDRLVLRLVELADSSPERQAGLAVTPKISQSTLAAMVGVSRENANRALAALTTRGVIRQEKGRYVLLDEAWLRRAAARDSMPYVPRDRRAVRPHEVS